MLSFIRIVLAVVSLLSNRTMTKMALAATSGSTFLKEIVSNQSRSQRPLQVLYSIQFLVNSVTTVNFNDNEIRLTLGL